MLSPDDVRSGIDVFRALRRRAERDGSQRYVVEGARFVHEAIRTQTRIEAALIAPGLLDRSSSDAAGALVRRGIHVREVTDVEFRELSVAVEPSGVAAIVRQRWTTPARPGRREAPLWLALGHVRSPGNLGTILRTAAAADVAGVLLLDRATDPFDPVAVRASMGAVMAVRLVRMTPSHLAAWSRRVRATVIGTSATARRDYRDLPCSRPRVVMLGCERRGMSPEQRRVCDLSVAIPMAAGTSSLNVAVAAGVLLFAAAGAHRRGHDARPGGVRASGR